MRLPYTDARGEFPLLFTACDHVIPFDSTTLDVGVTFRPQHAKYAQNVIEHMAMHFRHQGGCPSLYMAKMFKGAHVLMMRSKKWHPEHKKAYDPKHMQEGLSARDLSHAMAEFNLDISMVLKDAAMAVSREAAAPEADGVSRPKEASNASQQLSMLNSITTFRDADEEMVETPAPQGTSPPPTRTLKRNPWASPVPAAQISIQSPSTSATTITMASAESSAVQTLPVQEDSSLTTATEPAGMTEAQVKSLLAIQESQWEARMEQEIALRLAEQRDSLQKQHLARKMKRNHQVQTAQSSGGGQPP
jgi:hypothetical protein